MGFVKSQAELAKLAREKHEFYDAEMLVVMWETKPEIVKRLLPLPLKPVEKPLVTAFLAHYPKTDFGPGYSEGALFLRSEFGGVPGNYCLAMPMTLDMAMAGGRERMGYPKKLANISFKRSGNKAEGHIERHGVRFFTLRVKLSGKSNTEEFQNIILGETSAEGAVTYNFKHFPSCDLKGFDYNPRLVRERTVLRPSVAEWGEAEVTFGHSDHDPWSEVEVVRILGAIYTVGHNTMLPAEVVSETDAAAFAPYSYLKWDHWPHE
jgi:Acetoacetate decarboxylase (ADC)